MEEYLTLGKIIDSFSLDGTLKVYSTTNNGDIRYQKGNKLLLSKDNENKEITIISYRKNGVFDFVKCEEINNKEEALLYKGYEIKVIKNRTDLPKGSYFYNDLEGCSIFDEQKNLLGKVSRVEEFPAQITLRVSRKDKEDFFVPFIKEFIVSIDIENKCIIIKVIEGLL